MMTVSTVERSIPVASRIFEPRAGHGHRMVDAWEHHRRGRGERPSSGIDEHPMPTGVDEPAGVRGGDTVRGETVPPQHLLNSLPGDVGEEGLERIVEGAITDADTLESAPRETIASGIDGPAHFSAARALGPAGRKPRGRRLRACPRLGVISLRRENVRKLPYSGSTRPSC